MATIKIVFRESHSTKKGIPICIKIRYEGKPKYFTIAHCESDQWNHNKNRPYDLELRDTIKKSFKRIKKLLKKANKNQWSINDLMDQFKGIQHTSFYEFYENVIKDMYEKNKAGAAKNQEDCLYQLKQFYRLDLSFAQMNNEFIEAFKKWKYKTAGNTTVKGYLTRYRTIWSYAKKEHKSLKKFYPFENGTIPAADKTRKRFFTKDELHKIFEYSSDDEWEMKALARYKLAFFLRGFDFIDLATIRVEYVNGDYLLIDKRMKPTVATPMTIKIFPCAKELINKYSGDEYLLNIIKHSPHESLDNWKKYEYQRTKTNRKLNAIAKKLGLFYPLTTKTVRHTFNTLAKRIRIDREMRAEMLGHSWADITDIYDGDFIQEDVDEAHWKVIKDFV